MEKILNCTQLAALLVIVGGTLTIGALVAPTVFRELSRQEAGITMIEIFGKFDRWVFVSAILLFISKISHVIFVRKFNFLNSSGSLDWVLVLSLVGTIIVFLISVYHSQMLSPELNQAYENNSPIFETLHKRSEMLFKANFLIGLLLVFSFVI